MATSNIREKINTLQSLLQQADIESFQLGLVIKTAEQSSGDAQVDAQLQAQAQNARTQMFAVSRRVAVYREALTPLQVELQATPPVPALTPVQTDQGATS